MDAVVHREITRTLLFQPGGDLLDRLGGGHPVEFRGVHQHLVGGVLGEGVFQLRLRIEALVLVGGDDDDPYRQVEFPSELEVALVVGGNRHNGAVTVLHQHVVGHPDRNLLAGGGVDGLRARVHAGLQALLAGFAALHQVAGEGLFDVRRHRFTSFRRRDLLHEGMLGRQHHEGGAEQSVGARGEDADPPVRAADDLEVDIGAFRATDPIALQSFGRFGPVDPLQIVQQPLGVLGDPEKPLIQVTLRHLGGATLAAPVYDLFIRQHGLAGRAPVDRSRASLGQPGLIKLQEDPLGPLVVLGLRHIDHPVPVVHEPHPPELASEVLNVSRDQLHRMDAQLQGEVFRVDAESVEADGLEDVVPLQPLETAVDVRAREGVHVPHVQPFRRRVGVHHQVVVGAFRPIDVDPIEAGLLPALPPPLFDRYRVVALSHGPREAVAGPIPVQSQKRRARPPASRAKERVINRRPGTNINGARGAAAGVSRDPASRSAPGAAPGYRGPRRDRQKGSAGSSAPTSLAAATRPSKAAHGSSAPRVASATHSIDCLRFAERK